MILPSGKKHQKKQSVREEKVMRAFEVRQLCRVFRGKIRLGLTHHLDTTLPNL